MSVPDNMTGLVVTVSLGVTGSVFSAVDLLSW